MTLHLNANGSLTKNQKDRANELEINHMDYRIVVLQNVSNHYKSLIEKEPAYGEIFSTNPYIIIGHGPGWEEQAIKVKGTKIPIISTDICTVPLLEMGIIPDYIVTFEEAVKRINDKLFPYDKIMEHDIKVVGSKITRQWLADDLFRKKMSLERFTDYKDCSNVGLFGSLYAKKVLKADKIILIGMNCWNDNIKIKDIRWNHINYIPPFLNWYTDWRTFFRESPGLVVNCSQGGILYVDGVFRFDFAHLDVVNE